MASNFRPCSNCQTNEGIKRCVRCKDAFYCTRECQVIHWKNGHKKMCTVREQEDENEGKIAELSVENETSNGRESLTCYGCFVKEASFRCSCCKKQIYCSRACQKNHWKQHKTKCISQNQEKKPGQIQCGREDELSAENLRKALKYFMTLPSEPKYLKEFPIPNFLSEYRQTYPNDVHCFMLEAIYDRHKTFGEIELSLNNMEWSIDLLVKKFHALSTDLFQFLAGKPPPGEIFKNRHYTNYPKNMYQLYRNTPVKEKKFEFGKTYVFIGYVDLLQLVMGVFTGDAGKKAAFFGFDMSEICVARSLIVYEMMKMQSSLDSILEVWFSTGWSKDTLKTFKNACTRVITSSKQTPNVRDLISHWRHATITLKEAVSRWQAVLLQNDPMGAVSSLLKKQDRIDFCRYELTGQIFGQLELQCHGNVSMFSMTSPFKHYNLQYGPFLQSFNFSKNFHYDGNLFRSLEIYYKSKLQALVKLVAEGKVECTLRVMTVQLENKDAIEHIQSLGPDHINWNNVADFMRKESFFNLAYACSTKKTTHSMHFLNWSTIVCGTHILEYDGNRLEFHMEQKKVLHGFFMKRHRDGYIPFLRKDALVVYPLDLSNSVLALKYRHKFLEYYFDVDEFDINITDICGPDICNCFQRWSQIFTLSFDIKKK
ncbi:uncharacterized protein LOC130635505 isoform X1 [Hydractinia symbiolongicarpus]|uniref:uncharacterized protein LOC130635505 isoform X1 n=1 Tax=Hydractinia symbiolongicarpus TaxID=13093 RepID=UPI00254EF163|nr:uncharacterized protein LOC130635505 isoform X1 [Hydractinia symbiolongicarpus]